MLEVGSAFERGIDVERDLRAALAWYDKAAAHGDDQCAEIPGEANYRAGMVGELIAETQEEELRSIRHFKKALKLCHVKASLRAAKLLIQSRDGYQYSEYRYRGQWENEKAEYDQEFAEGIDLLEQIAEHKDTELADRIDALSILAELYEDGRIRCRYQFDPIGDTERFEVALEYYQQASQLGWDCDWAAARIERIKVRLKELESMSDDDDDNPEGT